MKISVNGEIVKTTASNLEILLQELEYFGDYLATAVNAELVPFDERQKYFLKEGDKIEILSPMQGG